MTYLVGAFTSPGRNFIDGEWHRIKEHTFTYATAENFTETWCGKTADDSTEPLPYMEKGRTRYDPVKGSQTQLKMRTEWPEPDCHECAVAAWQADYETLMKLKP